MEFGILAAMYKWSFAVLLVISCGSHPSPVPHHVVPGADTVSKSSIVDKGPILPAPKKSTPPESYTIDLNNDGVPDTITVATSLGDLHIFDTIRISIAHFGSTTFVSDSTAPWTNVDQWFLSSNTNAVVTGRFFVARTTLQSVLLLFGDLDGAGERSNFSIIDIEHNVPKLVLNQNERHLAIEAPVGLRDVDSNGRFEFVFRHIFEFDGKPDTLGGKIGPYSPYYVFTVDSACVLNRPLTKRYNEKYYVFAGYGYDEKVKVFYPNDDSRERLWK
jgi:hypothetical protein